MQIWYEMQVAFQNFARLREICLLFSVTPCKDVCCLSAEHLCEGATVASCIKKNSDCSVPYL